MRQNLLIPALVRAGDRARKFSLRQTLASVRTVTGDSLVLEMDETEPVGPDVGAAWAAEVVSSVSFYASSELWSLARVSWSAVGSEAVMRVWSRDPRLQPDVVDPIDASSGSWSQGFCWK